VAARLGRGVVACAIAVATVVATVLAMPSPVAADAQPGVSPTIAAEFIWAIEVVRSAHGLPGLVPDPSVSAAAQNWSGGMALFHTLVHDSQLGAVIAAVDPAWQAAGENIGTGPTPQSIEAAFIASPEHLANMLGAYTHVGVGVFVDGSGQIWVTERFYR